jgi:hypothetical protein
MSISLAELLPLVGCLDDAPGFDTPRERFRRFLLERVTDLPTVGALIDECQRSVGEQRHRALQDLVVIVGRLLGFAITFGSYGPAEDLDVDGGWRSPGLLNLVLELRTEQTPSATLHDLSRAVAAASANRIGNESSLGLCVVARQYAARGKLAQLIAAETRFPDLRVVSVRSLLTLAANVSAGRLAHAEIVELLRSGFALDFVIDLLDRPAGGDGGGGSIAAPDRPASVERCEPAFWIATIAGDEMAVPEQLLDSVIAHRRILAVSRGRGSHGQGSPGDWVGFFLADKGIVGHAQLASVVEDGASVIRHADRFSRVYRLAHVTLYAQPIVEAMRAGRPFAVPPPGSPLAGSYLAPIAREDFLALTTYCDDDSNVEGPRSATA